MQKAKNWFVANRIYVIVIVVFLFGFSLGYVVYDIENKTVGSDETRVVYSLDKRQNDREIVKLIDDAKEYIYFAVYYFTQKDIAEALLRAKSRGIKVEGITDREGSENAPNAAVVKLLRSAGIPLVTQKHEDGIMHIKAIVTEKAYASGSYNWTQAATDANDEVLEIGHNEKIRKQYLEIIRKVIVKNMSGAGSVTGEIQKIDFTDAPKHIGEYAEVSGEIVKNSTSRGGTVFFDFCRTAAKCPFSAVIFESDVKKFKDIAGYKGAVTISGIIRSYQGKAEIIVEEPEQINLH